MDTQLQQTTGTVISAMFNWLIQLQLFAEPFSWTLPYCSHLLHWWPSWKAWMKSNNHTYTRTNVSKIVFSGMAWNGKYIYIQSTTALETPRKDGRTNQLSLCALCSSPTYLQCAFSLYSATVVVLLLLAELRDHSQHSTVEIYLPVKFFQNFIFIFAALRRRHYCLLFSYLPA